MPSLVNTHSALWKQGQRREQVHTRAGTPAGSTHFLILPGTFSKTEKKKRSLRWIQHDTPVMQQAASSEAMHRENLSSEKQQELQRTALFSKVILNGTFPWLSQSEVVFKLLNKFWITTQECRNRLISMPHWMLWFCNYKSGLKG